VGLTTPPRKNKLVTKILKKPLAWMDEMGRECNTNGEKRNAYIILMGKSEGKRPLGRPKRS
jgi:hypothetical protein